MIEFEVWQTWALKNMFQINHSARPNAHQQKPSDSLKFQSKYLIDGGTRGKRSARAWSLCMIASRPGRGR
jgi:hypothetical protein